MRLAPHSLRARLTTVFTLGAAVALLLALALLYVTLDRQLATTLDADLRSRAGDLVAAVRTGDVDVVARDPMAQLYAADGTLLAGSPSLADRRLTTVEERHALDDDGLGTRTLPADEDAAVTVLRVLTQRLDDGRFLSVGASAEPLHPTHEALLQVFLLAAPLLLCALAVGG